MLQNHEFIQEFVEEATSHIESIESGMLSLDSENLNPAGINDIFRAVHSVKGTAGFFGLGRIVALSHAMENVLGEMRNSKLTINQSMIDTLLSSNDCLRLMILDVANSDSMDISKHVENLTAFTNSNTKEVTECHTSAAKDSIHMEKAKPANFNVERELLDNAFKYGHKCYKVQLKLNEDLGSRNVNPIAFFKKIESIGTIITANTDISNVNGLDECLNSDIVFTFIFSTVLERELLPLALDIPEERVVELDENAKLKTILSNTASSKQDQKLQAVTVDISASEQGKAAASKQNQSVLVEDSIRVHVSLLNSLLNLASEMVLGRNQLLRITEMHRKDIPGIEPILQNIDRITTELQERIMQTRMQPVANVFNKFPRIIRDLSKKLSKDIELHLEGVDVELDKSIIEALGDPLTHLVRNAADHGLELPHIREAFGKPKAGTIILKAYHEGGYVNVDVIDDGAGIDIEKIKIKALEKELISRNDAMAIGEQEALQLLFKPGFSTAERITDVSGRGVGMDVVKTNIEKLGGTIEIFTAPGKGTTFRLMLPLTLAIIPSLIVEVERQKFALPQVNLQEIVRIKANDASRKIEYIHNSEVLRLRGKLLPIIHLADILGIKRTCQNDGNVIRILVIKIGSKRFGIAVDQIHGNEEILVKPLPVFLKDSKCYSGVTILGDGKASIILDPEGIITKANLRFYDDHLNKGGRDCTEVNEGMHEQQNLLLFQCSGPEVFAMDLSLVSRVEEIAASDIERIGDKEYIKLRGNSLRVIRPEDFLPVSKAKNDSSKLYIIIPKLVKHPIGILIEKIQDTVQTTIKLNEEDIKAKGLMGSTILNERIVLLLNMYELFEKADPEHYAASIDKNTGTDRIILLAEDTPFFQKLEKNYLEMAGYQVIPASNGREALQILKNTQVDAVVSDINMPLLDGLELVKRIREDKQLSNLPVIAVTSMTGDLQKKAGIDAGFDFYEFKLDKQKLLEKIELALKARRSVV